MHTAVEQFKRQIVRIRDLNDNFRPKEDQQRQRDKNNSLGKLSKCYVKEVCNTIFTQSKIDLILRIICVHQNYLMPKILELSGRHLLRTYLTQL